MNKKLEEAKKNIKYDFHNLSFYEFKNSNYLKSTIFYRLKLLPQKISNIFFFVQINNF